MSFTSEQDVEGLPPVPLLLGMLLAFGVSVGLVWLAAGSSLAAAAYGGALIAVVLALLQPAVSRAIDAFPRVYSELNAKFVFSNAPRINSSNPLFKKRRKAVIR